MLTRDPVHNLQSLPMTYVNDSNFSFYHTRYQVCGMLRWGRQAPLAIRRPSHPPTAPPPPTAFSCPRPPASLTQQPPAISSSSRLSAGRSPGKPGAPVRLLVSPEVLQRSPHTTGDSNPANTTSNPGNRKPFDRRDEL